MPFCSNCGKLHTNDAKYCPNCGNSLNQQPSTQQFNAQPQYYTPQYSQHNYHQTPTLLSQNEVKGVYGLGKAIAATIISFFALILSIVSLIVESSSEHYVSYYTSYNYTYGYRVDYDTLLLGFILCLLATSMSILSIVFGANSIRNFKYAKSNLDRVPVPTLIMGIHSLVMGIISAIYCFLALIVAIILFL